MYARQTRQKRAKKPFRNTLGKIDECLFVCLFVWVSVGNQIKFSSSTLCFPERAKENFLS